MDILRKLIESKEDAILKALNKEDHKDELKIYLDYLYTAFTVFVRNFIFLNKRPESSHIFAFFVAEAFRKLNVSSCSPKLLEEISNDLANEISKLKVHLQS